MTETNRATAVSPGEKKEYVCAPTLAPDGSVLHLSSERSLILKAHRAKIAVYA